MTSAKVSERIREQIQAISYLKPSMAPEWMTSFLDSFLSELKTWRNIIQTQEGKHKKEINEYRAALTDLSENFERVVTNPEILEYSESYQNARTLLFNRGKEIEASLPEENILDTIPSVFAGILKRMEEHEDRITNFEDAVNEYRQTVTEGIQEARELNGYQEEIARQRTRIIELLEESREEREIIEDIIWKQIKYDIIRYWAKELLDNIYLGKKNWKIVNPNAMMRLKESINDLEELEEYEKNEQYEQDEYSSQIQE